MRPIRYVEETGGGNVIEKQSLEVVKALWNEWEIHCLILVSFGLQVFLFFFAGMRRRVVAPVLRLLLWLAYLSATSVAIFVLGHLSIHAGGPRHQLLFFWAPFTLLHLGGQDSITAFSRQDSELWMRHLLGLVSQVVVAGYVVSRSSWPDRWLLAAMVLMFLSGSYKYAELTMCLYLPNQSRIRDHSFRYYHPMVPSRKSEMDDQRTATVMLKERFDEMVKVHGRQPPAVKYDEDILVVVYDSPPNERHTIVGADSLPSLLQMLKASADRCRAYDYVSARLVFIYEILYTKVQYRAWILDSLLCFPFGDVCFPKFFTLLLCFIFPFLSSLTALVFFMVAKKGQQYSRADVIVSYVLLIGAIILEIASLLMSILSYYFLSTGRHLISHLATYIHHTWRHRKQWSEMLPQYNMINSHTQKIHNVGIVSLIPECISKHLDDKTLTHIPITEDLKKFVLDKLLDFGTGHAENWKFSSFRGQLALEKLMYSHEEKSARPRTPLLESINDVDAPTSVLIWHIATDICYSRDDTDTVNNFDEVKQMSREISNYIMYLVFKCGVLITNSTELLHHRALNEMKAVFEKQRSKQVNLGEKEAVNMVYEAHKDGHQLANTENRTFGTTRQVSQLELLKNSMKDLDSPFLPRACAVANELNGITGEDNRWKFIAAVWLEMLYYIAPRCGATFHSEHLSTGGEFVTHIVLLMRLLGPFLPPPSGGST